MIGINKAPVVLELETVFTHVLAAIAPKAIGRGEIVAVIVQNPLINTDGTNNNSQIFVGSATNLIYSMIPGQESPIVYAEDQKDIYIRLDFPAVNPNGGILAAAILAGGANYTVGDVVSLLSNGTPATLTVLTLDGHITAAAVAAGGAGYVAGNILNVTGGNGLGRIVVDTVDGGGAVLTAHSSVAGSGYTNGAVANTTGGAGAGATFTLTATRAIATFNITTPGTQFVAETVEPVFGGTGAGATVTVLIVETVIPETADINLLIYRLRKGGKQ